MESDLSLLYDEVQSEQIEILGYINHGSYDGGDWQSFKIYVNKLGTLMAEWECCDATTNNEKQTYTNTFKNFVNDFYTPLMFHSQMFNLIQNFNVI